MAALAEVAPGGDAEQQTGAFFSLLHNYLPESPVAAVEPPNLDVAVCHAMQRVLAMGHNRTLAQRVHSELRRVVATAGAGSPASLAQATVELVFNVIMETAVPAAYATAPPLGPEGRRALLAAFDKVGVYARANPFPAAQTTRCEKRTNCPIYTTERKLVLNCTSFEVLRPLGGDGLYSGSGRCYALVETKQTAIYGSVKEAQVIRVEYTGANSVVLWWTKERVAVKCIEKIKICEMQQSGVSMSESPLKEMGCLAHLTRRTNGTLAGPEVVRGDVRRVLPMVDCLEDKEAYYMVRCCHFKDHLRNGDSSIDLKCQGVLLSSLSLSRSFSSNVLCVYKSNKRSCSGNTVQRLRNVRGGRSTR